jgi:putative DNA primase/helicase
VKAAQDDLLRAALEYAGRGWRVFPLHGIGDRRCTCGDRGCSSPGKHPIVRRGLHEASTDEDQVEAWWKQSPLANIAVVTGVTAGIVVVDVDLPRAVPSLDRVIDRLPRTLVGLTGGGGIHLVYRSTDRELRNTARRLPGICGPLPGIDLRANGGYIVAPPSLHSSGNRYTWLDPSQTLAPAPGWLKQPKRTYKSIVVSAPKFSSGDGTPYGLAGLRNECARIRSAPVGTRNHQLYRSAKRLAHLVAAGEVQELAARSSLVDAGRSAGLSSTECYRTIASAFRPC